MNKKKILIIVAAIAAIIAISAISIRSYFFAKYKR